MDLARILAYAAFVVLIAIGAFWFGIIAYHFIRDWDGDTAKSIRENSIQSIGLPVSALASFALVYSFPEALGKTLKFKMLGAEVSGPASQLLFWVLCFLAFILAIRLTRWVVKRKK